MDRATAIEAERERWYELVALVRGLTAEECLEPGYYSEPAWSVRDLVGHLGCWLAQAELELERIGAGTYKGHDVDIDALNASFLEAMRGQPWSVAWLQANAGRTLMLQVWYELAEPDAEADWWIHKSGVEHYDEHLARLRAWVGELVARRPPPA